MDIIEIVTVVSHHFMSQPPDPLRQKFAQIDIGGKQYLDQNDIQMAFSTRNVIYPKLGARILIKLFSSNNIINYNQFIHLNYFVMQQVNKFKMYQQNGVITEQILVEILQDTGFDLQSETINSLFTITKQIFELDGNTLSIMEFQFISSFLHLASQLFNEWNQDGDGVLHIGPEKMLCLLMWFM